MFHWDINLWRYAWVTTASSRQERIDAALRELPDGCAGSALDVRDETQIAALFERVGEFDHLAFTAGNAFTPRPLVDLGLGDARAILDVRFWGAVAVIKHAAPRIRPGGSIGLTTGTVGQRPVPGAALAAAGAGAAEGLARGLAVELAPVRVNARWRGGAERTVRLAPSLITGLRRHADARGLTLSATIAEAARLYLDRVHERHGGSAR